MISSTHCKLFWIMYGFKYSLKTFLDNIKHNTSVKYLYLSVPLFSPTVIFECIFDDVFPRLLSMGHTHLYSKQSLEWLYKHFNFDPIAEWWFGTDAVDLFRSISVLLEKKYVQNKQLNDIWLNMFKPLLNDIQLSIDKKRLSSEVHTLIKIR